MTPKQYFLIIGLLILFIIPIVSATTVTIYPTIDSLLNYETDVASWSNARNATTAGWVGDNGVQPDIEATTTSGHYDRMGRGVLLFNTSVIPASATITSATLGLNFGSVTTTLGTPNLAITGGVLASNTTAAAGDYDGYTQVQYATQIPYSSIIEYEYTNITLTNLTFIQKGSPPAFSTVFIRDSYDVNNSGPSWSSGGIAALERYTLTDEDPSVRPFLEVTYTEGGGGSDPWEGYVPASITGGAPLNVTFTDISYNSPTAWNWSFKNVVGNNTEIWFSQVQNPYHIFGIGNYSIRLNSSNSYGYNITPELVFVNVTAIPIANFTANQTVLYLRDTWLESGGVSTRADPVLFTDLSTNSPTAWHWHIENYDGIIWDSFTTQNVTYHEYIWAGLHWVELNASNSYGYNVTRKLNYINVTNAIPTAGFMANQTTGISPLGVHFYQNSTNHTTSAAWYWYNNETVSSTSFMPTTTFTTGVYNVRVNISNPAGSDWENKTAYISVNGPPAANFTANITSGVVPLAVLFTDSSTGSPTAWNWSWNRWPTNLTQTYFSEVQNPTYTFTSSGVYTIILSASNAYGNTYMQRSQYINATAAVVVPVTGFSANVTSGTSPLTVGFTDSSTNTPTNWDWYWYSAENKSSDLQNPITTLTTGFYNVRLYTSNTAGGDWENKTAYIDVSSGVVTPVANFVADRTTVYLGDVVQFTDLSTNSPTSWYWEIERDVYGYQFFYTKNVSYTTLALGTHTVQLTATNAAGSDSELKINYITVLAVPPPTPTPTPIPTSSAGPQIISISSITSSRVSITISGITGNDVWIIYGQNSGKYAWITPNTTATSGLASVYVDSPMLGNTRYYAKACDSTGCGNEASWTTAIVTPAPATNYGAAYKNITGMR